MSVQDVARFLLRGMLLAVVLAGAFGFVAYQWSQRQEPEYRAEATILLARETADLSQFGISSVTAPPISPSAYQAAAESDRVLAEALRTLGDDEPTESDLRGLRRNSAVEPEVGARESNLLRVEAFGTSPEVAAERANAVSSALVDWDRRRSSDSLNRVIATLEEQINALSEQIRSLQTLDEADAQTQIDGLVGLRAEQQQQLGYARALTASAEGVLSVLQPAGTTPQRVAPRPMLTAAVAAFLAIALAYGLLLLRSAFTTRLRGLEDVTRSSGLPVLAQFPMASRDEAVWREAGGYLRTNLLAATEDVHPKVFMVTSADGIDGKSLVAMQLAEGMVRHGFRTLLVDADLRSPSLVRRYPVPKGRAEEVSTHAWLLDPSEARVTVRVPMGDEGQLHLVPQFERLADASELLGRGFRAALQAWEAKFDVIVIDTPPVLAVADPLIVAPSCSGTVLVIDQKRTDRNGLVTATDLLRRHGVNVFGIVANSDAASRATPLYGYGHEGASRPRAELRTSQATVTELPRKG